MRPVDGITLDETAHILGCSLRQVARHIEASPTAMPSRSPELTNVPAGRASVAVSRSGTCGCGDDDLCLAQLSPVRVRVETRPGDPSDKNGTR